MQNSFRKNTSKVAVVGALGFIGKHLVKKLHSSDEIESIHILSRKDVNLFQDLSKVKFVKGNLLEKVTLENFLVENCILINLAFIPNVPSEINLIAIKNLIALAKQKKIKKFIHCSTAVVSGRTYENPLTENSFCCPLQEYESTKIKIENHILKDEEIGFETVIVRPTGVFGPSGENLKKLINDLSNGSKLKNYLKSCLYNKRTMNLVSVENVVGAIFFLTLLEVSHKKEIFNIAEDHEESNNYRSVEKIMMENLGINDYLFPRISLPQSMLRLVLKFVGQSNIDPQRKYSTKKLEQIGWESVSQFEERINAFLNWYKKEGKL